MYDEAERQNILFMHLYIAFPEVFFYINPIMVSEVTTNFNNGLVSSVLAVTGGHSIDGRLAILRVLKTLGVRVMALASNCSTDWLVALKEI